MSDFHSNSPDDSDPASLEGGAAHGNRPAEGARRASPGEVLSGGFQGSANAGDFLGLDLEVNEPSASAGAGHGLELSSVDPYAQAQAAPAGYDYAGQGDFSEDAPLEDYADEPLPEPHGAIEEELLEDEEELATARPAGRLVALAFVVGLVAVVGAVLGPKLLKKDEVRTARTESPSTTTRPAAQPAGGEAAAGGEVAEAGTESGEGTELVGSPSDVSPDDEPDAGTERTPRVATARPGVDGSQGSSEESGENPSLVDVFRRLAGGESSTGSGDPGVTISELPRFGGGDPIDGTTFDASLFSPEAWMSGDLVDMVWRDTSVPLEAIAHPVRIMTPRVGFVRVTFQDKTVVEGRLYAVGQNRIWLENDLGRLGLDGEGVVGFERLHPEEVQTASFDTASIGKGKRVRVDVPGGALYGRVLSVIDEDVVLVTDAGARVTLHAPKLEELGPSRAILVER